MDGFVMYSKVLLSVFCNPEYFNGVCPSLIALALFFLLFFLFLFSNRLRKVFSKIPLWSIGMLVFIVGMVLFWIGFNEKGCENNYVALFTRSALSSMEMFLSHSDLIEINEELHNNSVYMLFFSLVHFLAIIVSALVLVKFLGIRMLSWFKILSWNWSYSSKNLHVFFNIDSNSIALAKDIIEIQKEQKTQDRIVFICQKNSVHYNSTTRFSFSNFLHSSDPEVEKYLSELDTEKMIVLNTEKLFDNIESTLDTTSRQSTMRLFKLSGIWFLDKLVKKTLIDKKVNFYFLSENEQENMLSIMALKNFSANKDSYLDNDNFFCYCHACKTSINASLLNADGLMYRIHLIDSASLSALELKKNKEAHPIKYVKIDDKKGVVETPFTGMVIGFGETGRDVFRFLYEFSSFVKSVDVGSDDKDIIYEQDRKLIVVDSNLEPLKSEFLTEARCLREEKCIEWCNYSTHTIEFEDLMKSNVSSLNYVVIAVNDDMEAISLMQKVYTTIVQYRESDNKSKVGIYVRVRGKNAKKTFDNIKKYFDEKNPQSGISINPYGSDDKVFSYNTIVNETLEVCAKEFFYRYSKVLADLEDNQAEKTRLETTTPAEEWKRRRENKQDSLEGLIDVYYKEEQDRSNVWHIYTKRELLGYNILNDEERTELEKKLQQNESLKNAIAYCEHLRWNSKMYLMGFCKGKEKKMLRKEHPCLESCSDLIRGKNEYTLKYDREVALFSLSKKVEEIFKQNQ